MLRTALLLVCSCLPLAAGDALEELAAIRDGLRGQVAARLGQAGGDAVDLSLLVDRGMGRGGMRLDLYRLGGTWSGRVAEGLPKESQPRGVDASKLVLDGQRLKGDVIVAWAPDDPNPDERGNAPGEGDDPVFRQTFTLDAAVSTTEPRLVVTLHRFVGGAPWKLAFKPKEGGGWAFEREVEAPVELVTWGPFERKYPDIVPDAEGRFQAVINLTFVPTDLPKRPKPEAYVGNQPVITIAGRLVDGRFDSTWTMQAAGGKHLLGCGQDAVVGSVQTQSVDGRFHSLGQAGEWTGRFQGPVVPASPGLNLLGDAGAAPAADDHAGRARRGALLYRHILAIDLALRRFPLPLPLQDAINRSEVIEPANADAAQAAAYLDGLLIHARRIATARDAGTAPLAGPQRPDDREFGPFQADVALLDGNRLPAVAAEGPQAWRWIGDWRFLGPFPVLDQESPVFHPEIVPVDGVTYRRSRFFVGPDAEDGKKGLTTEQRDDAAAWVPAGGERALVSAPLIPECSSGSMRYFRWYAQSSITSASEQTVWLALQVQGQVRLWLDDAVVWESGPAWDERTPAVFPLKLTAGAHRLLLRVASSGPSNRHFGTIDYFNGYDPRPQGRIDFTSFAMHVALTGKPGGSAAGSQGVAPAADGPVGFRRDGSGRFPEADPPLAWDLAKGINVAWRAPVAYGTADLVLRDGRLIVAAEPHQVICYDAVAGKEVWRRSADLLGLIGEGKWPGDPLVAMNADLRKADSLPSDAAESKAQAEALRGKWKDLTSFLRSRDIPVLGTAGATPVVAADRVYATFGTGVAACWDLASGEQKWLVATGAPWNDPGMGSPVLVDGKLVIQAHLPKIAKKAENEGAYALIALDAADGKKMWTATGPERRVLTPHDRPAGLGNGLAVLRLANAGKAMTLLITSEGAVIDAANGALIFRDVLDMEANRAPPVVEGDTAFFATVLGEQAVRFWLDTGGRVACRTAWSNRHTNGRGAIKTVTAFGNLHWMKGPILADGLLYAWRVDSAHVPQHHPCPWNGLDVYDPAKEGRTVVRQRAVLRDVTDPTVAPVQAGKYLLVADGGAPVAGFQGRTDTGSLAMVEVGRSPVPLAQSLIGRTRTPPVCAGDRLYLRSFSEVVCIRQETPEGKALVEQVLGDTLFEAIPPRPVPAPVTEVPARPYDWEPGAGVPVYQLKPKQIAGEWLVAGPFPGKTPGDLLPGLGGEAAALPVPGAKAGPAGAEIAVALLDAKFVNRDQWKTPKSIDVLGSINGASESSVYYYTVLDNPVKQVVQLDCPGANLAIRLNGVAVKHQDILRLGIGRYPLLVRITTGRIPPFLKNKSSLEVAPLFEPAKDPGSDYRDWVAQVRANRARFERLVKDLPNTGLAGKAQIYLKQLEDYDAAQGASK